MSMKKNKLRKMKLEFVIVQEDCGLATTEILWGIMSEKGHTWHGHNASARS